MLNSVVISSTRSEATSHAANVVLRDGSVAQIRKIRPDDEPRLLAFLRALPEEDRRLRFFSVSTDLARTARDETSEDEGGSLGLLATVGPSERVVGHALYARTGKDRAEVAFAVAHDFQGHGLATLLLGQLAEAAAADGVETFEAIILPENRRMLEVLSESGFPTRTRYSWDTLEVSFPTSLSPEALERFEQREEIAAANALRRILYPRSVAVIGASRRPEAVGGALVSNLLAAGFRGSLYPVNPSARMIQSLPCYPSVEAIPDPVDLAVIAVPAARVAETAEQCGRKGVASLIVVSAGFAEVGPEGRDRQAELLRICRASGMRLVGPNCIGVVNTDPDAPLNATFGPLLPRPGRIGLATQSGALGLAAIDFTSARQVGFSSVVSTGNKADISTNDLLGYWHTDQRTDVILMYVESFGNPRKFSRLARAIGRSKPIVALKAGRSAVGARASASHTGALLSGSDVTVDALFHQAGVIRTDTLDELLDVANLLTNQPLPAGANLAIVTNVGGPAIMCADTAVARGLHVPTLSEDTQAALRTFLPPEASVLNPVDMLASASADQYTQTLRVVADDPNIDAVIAIFLPPLATITAEDVSQAVSRAVDELAPAKPVMAVFMSAQPLPRVVSRASAVPTYHMPEPAAIALAHAARYAAWRAQPIPQPAILANIQRDEAGLLLAQALREGVGWLSPQHVQKLLALYGIGTVEQRIVSTPEDVAAATTELGDVVAVKVIAPGLVHKSDVDGVTLRVRTAESAARAAEAMAQHVQAVTGNAPTGFVVQRMLSSGVEMLVGVVNDPLFGPIVACGAGGTQVEVLHDMSVRLTPLTSCDAETMIRELHSFPLLSGYRGSPPCALGALEDVVMRIGALAEDHAQIAEIDCNPVIVTSSDAVVVDARIRIDGPPARRPLGARA